MPEGCGDVACRGVKRLHPAVAPPPPPSGALYWVQPLSPPLNPSGGPSRFCPTGCQALVLAKVSRWLPRHYRGA